MAVSRLSVVPKIVNHFVKLRILASTNCRAVVRLYSTVLEQCSTGYSRHGSDITDNKSHSVTNVKVLEARASKLEEQVRNLTEKYERALADTDTVRRRTQKFVEDAKLFGIQSFCRDLVEVMDLLEHTAKELGGEGAQVQFQGLARVQDRLQGVLVKHGLEKMSPVGGRYDPYQHEVVCHTVAEGMGPGIVTLVKQDGYKLHGRTIRHARVGIAMEMQEQ